MGSDTTRFIYHGQHVLEELDGSDTLLRLFAYADGWDNVVMMEAEDVADVDNDANTTELKRFYYHTQLIGSITHITDDDEVVVESYEYDAYGNTTIYDINSSSVSGSQIENPYMYTARRMDEESGLYHYRARAYSPTLRRFIQRDPLEYVDGPNAMAYVTGQPTRMVDPEGLWDRPSEARAEEAANKIANQFVANTDANPNNDVEDWRDADGEAPPDVSGVPADVRQAVRDRVAEYFQERAEEVQEARSDWKYWRGKGWSNKSEGNEWRRAWFKLVLAYRLWKIFDLDGEDENRGPDEDGGDSDYEGYKDSNGTPGHAPPPERDSDGGGSRSGGGSCAPGYTPSNNPNACGRSK